MGKLPEKQQGFILAASLMLLLIVTLLGVSGISSVTLHEKMSSNLRESDRAFEAGLMATDAAETWLAAQLNQPEARNAVSGSQTPNVWAPESVGSFYALSTWADPSTPPRQLDLPASAGVAISPVFYTEEWASRYLGSSINPASQHRITDPRVWYYRNTVKAFGGNVTATSMQQSIYARLW